MDELRRRALQYSKLAKEATNDLDRTVLVQTALACANLADAAEQQPQLWAKVAADFASRLQPPRHQERGDVDGEAWAFRMPAWLHPAPRRTESDPQASSDRHSARTAQPRSLERR
jgi:hypothetical protein